MQWRARTWLCSTTSTMLAPGKPCPGFSSDHEQMFSVWLQGTRRFLSSVTCSCFCSLWLWAFRQCLKDWPWNLPFPSYSVVPAFTSWLLKLSVQHGGAVPVVSWWHSAPYACSSLSWLCELSFTFILFNENSFCYQDLTKNLTKIKHNFHNAVKKLICRMKSWLDKMQDTIEELCGLGL